MREWKWYLALACVALLMIPQDLTARFQESNGGVLIQINRNVTVTPDDNQDVVVVIRGNAVVSGNIPVVVLIDGTLSLDNARVGHLVGVNADIDVGAGSVVTDDVRLMNSTIRAGSSTCATHLAIGPNIRR